MSSLTCFIRLNRTLLPTFSVIYPTLAKCRTYIFRIPCLGNTLRPPQVGNIPVHGHVPGNDNSFIIYLLIHWFGSLSCVLLLTDTGCYQIQLSFSYCLLASFQVLLKQFDIRKVSVLCAAIIRRLL